GALNIDSCRVAADRSNDRSGWSVSGSRASENVAMSGPNYDREPKPDNELGRWPADIVLTHDHRCEKVGTVEVPANPTWDTPNRNTEPSAFTGAAVSKVRHANRRDGEESADRRYTERGSTSF